MSELCLALSEEGVIRTSLGQKLDLVISVLLLDCLEFVQPHPSPFISIASLIQGA